MEILKYTVVVIEERTNAILVKCGYCKGEGTGHGYSICPVCKGAGKVWLKIPSDWDCDIGVVKCGYCKGEGTGHGYSICPVCKGVGSVWVGNLKTY